MSLGSADLWEHRQVLQWWRAHFTSAHAQFVMCLARLPVLNVYVWIVMIQWHDHTSVIQSLHHGLMDFWWMKVRLSWGCGRISSINHWRWTNERGLRKHLQHPQNKYYSFFGINGYWCLYLVYYVGQRVFKDLQLLQKHAYNLSSTSFDYCVISLFILGMHNVSFSTTISITIIYHNI